MIFYVDSISISVHTCQMNSSAFVGSKVEVPHESHEVCEEDPVLRGHQVDVDHLRDGPDLPVGQHRVVQLPPDTGHGTRGG